MAYQARHPNRWVMFLLHAHNVWCGGASGELDVKLTVTNIKKLGIMLTG
jgi:hypothetical protein